MRVSEGLYALLTQKGGLFSWNLLGDPDKTEVDGWVSGEFFPNQVSDPLCVQEAPGSPVKLAELPYYVVVLHTT